jgi:hypothetical protein
MRRLLIGIVTLLAAFCSAPYLVERVEAFGGAGGGTDLCWKIGAFHGWTLPCPTTGAGTCNFAGTGTHTGSCFYYVSNSGDDLTCVAETTFTETPTQACATIGKVTAAIRSGKPDWVLFDRGSTWTVPDISTEPSSGGNYINTATTNTMCKVGVSRTSPIVFVSYGTGARPLLKWSNMHASSSRKVFGSNNCSIHPNYLAIFDLDFHNYKADPDDPDFDSTTDGPWLRTNSLAFNSCLSAGAKLGQCPKFVFVENVRMRYLSGPALQNYEFAMVRRSASNGGGGANSIDGESMPVMNVYWIENVDDHNAWDTAPPRLADVPRGSGTHNVYGNSFETSPNSVGSIFYYGNISSRSSYDCHKNRQGGRMINNFYFQCTEGFEIGKGNTYRTGFITGSNGIVPANSPTENLVAWNVSQENARSGTGTSAGVHANILGILQPMTVHNNLTFKPIAGATSTGLGHISIDGDAANVTARNNVVCGLLGGSNDVHDDGGASFPQNNVIGTNTTRALATGTDNIGQASCTSPGLVGPDTTRDVQRYDSEVLGGPGTFANFLACALANERGAPPFRGREAEFTGWDARCTAAAVNAWIREGFGMQAVPDAADLKLPF